MSARADPGDDRPVTAERRVPGLDLPGSASVTASGGTTVLLLDGEIDAAVVRAFERRYLRTGEPAVDVIDAERVTFLDSLGLRLMVRCCQEAARQGRATTLRHPSAPVRRVLTMTGLSSLFDAA